MRPRYNQVRIEFGHGPAQGFADVTSDGEIGARLAQSYGDVGDVDAWVGLLSEDQVSGALVSESLRSVLADQFRWARNGDRFWHRGYMSGPAIAFVESGPV
jgi:hypothetical protein